MPSLDDFKEGSADFRQSLRRNRLRTMMVIALFFIIYASIGFLIDVAVYEQSYPNVPIPIISIALLHFSLFPSFTIGMIIIAAISLMVTYTFYDKLMLLGTNYHEITDTSDSFDEKQLYNVVTEMKIAAGLRFMPKVFIIDADYMNAFASGYSEKSALVAITYGLMKKLNRDELQAVMAHELTHIRHNDIKLTLTASILANLSLVVIDILFYQMLFNSNRRESGNRANLLFTLIYALRIILPFVTLVLLLYLSRTRELMADAGCVELMRQNEPLARALIKIQEDHQSHQSDYQKAYGNTAHENLRIQSYLFDPTEVGIKPEAAFSDLFSTHPNLTTRLKAIGYIQKESKHDN